MALSLALRLRPIAPAFLALLALALALRAGRGAIRRFLGSLSSAFRLGRLLALGTLVLRTRLLPGHSLARRQHRSSEERGGGRSYDEFVFHVDVPPVAPVQPAFGYRRNDPIPAEFPHSRAIARF